MERDVRLIQGVGSFTGTTSDPGEKEKNSHVKKFPCQ
jgi:hypothetical protein